MTVRVLLARLLGVFRREDAELVRDIETHLDLLTAEYIARGVPPAEARLAARRAFGGVQQLKERYQDQRGLPVIDALRQDLKYGLRSLIKTPIFSAVTLLTLTVAIGANAMIFSLINLLLLRPLPVPHPEQLVDVSLIDGTGGRRGFSLPMLAAIEQRQQVFSGLFGYSGGPAHLEFDGDLTLVARWAVTGTFYRDLGQMPVLGRLIEPDDVDLVAVLSHALWQRRFSGDPGVLGRRVLIEGQPFTIIGVTRSAFRGLGVGEDGLVVTVPMPARAVSSAGAVSGTVDVMGRLKSGVTLEQAQAQLESFWPELLAATVPSTSLEAQRNAFHTMRVQLASAETGVEPFLRSRFTRPLYMLLTLMGLVLLIACVHLAGLMLARAAARSHELSVRIALGAGAWRVARQFVTESLLLALGAAALGLVVAREGSGMLAAFMTQQFLIVPVFDFTPDLRVLAVTGMVALVSGILFGVTPVWFTTRRDPASALQYQSRGVVASTGRLGKGLVVCQVALTLSVLTGAGLLAQSLRNARSADRGFQKHGVLVVSLMPRPGGYAQLDKAAYYRDLIRRVASLPGVQGISLANERPATDEGLMESVRASGEMADQLRARIVPGVAPEFFEMLGITIRRGRDVNWSDTTERPRIALVSQAVAEGLFPASEAVGRRINIGTNANRQLVEIVGVVDDVHLFDIRDPNRFMVYVAALQEPAYLHSPYLTLRISGDPLSVGERVGREVDALGREYVLWRRTLEELEGQTLVVERLMVWLGGFFGVLTLILAVIGVYGLLSYAVVLRTREIGIRMALGAQQHALTWSVVRDALALVSLGVIIGMPGALAATRLVSGLLFALSPQDPATLGTVVVALLLTGLLAAYLPARRASRVDPLVALRCD